jgi:UDP-2,4-diacetamido-2,4,6-trideoxy-beta-L-altropyranose hydrolase
MRCLALAEEWRARGGSVTFALTEESAAVRARIERGGFAVAVASNPKELDVALGAVRPGWVVLDGYRFGAAEQAAAAASGARALVVDDGGVVGTYATELVLDPNLFAHEAPYAMRSPKTRVLLGPTYALLRREFTLEPPPPARSGPARHVLFTFGGADPASVSELAIAAWDALADLGLEGVLLVGGANPRREAIAEAAAGRRDLRVLYDAPNVPELMRWADVAVAAAGGTCFELAYSGVPAVVVVTADNQRNVAEALAARGVARSLGVAPPTVAALAAAVRALVLDDAGRASMSTKAQTLIDGRGPSRVVDAMEAIR